MAPTSPIMTQQNSCLPNNDVLQSILSRLDKMDSKLNQLNNIQTSVNKINERLNAMDRKIADIENGQKFVGEKYDTLMTKADQNTHKISEANANLKSVKEDNAKIKATNKSLVEDIIDLKCRSMRDNLLFFGVTEQPPTTATTTPTQPPEDCADLVFKSFRAELKIENPQAKISIDRAHRIGRFSSGKTRPIVAKFRDSSSKQCVKDALKLVDLKASPCNVSEQYPQEVKDRRRTLVPIMVQARKDGKKAVLVRDKLYINNVLYSSESSHRGAEKSVTPYSSVRETLKD